MARSLRSAFFILSNFYPIPRGLRQAVSALADVINQYSTRWSHFVCLEVSTNFSKQPGITPLFSNPFDFTVVNLENADLSSFQLSGTNIQWDNLTHLNLHNMSITDCLLILCNTPRLVLQNFPHSTISRRAEYTYNYSFIAAISTADHDLFQ
jgi:uncharacterized protein YjbI with pentapeptide repeats